MKQYKPMLARSAEVPEPERFNEQLRLEKQSEGYKIDQMVVLAHLTRLLFASTIPQSKKTNNEHFP
jgi:hypothetical protein